MARTQHELQASLEGSLATVKCHRSAWIPFPWWSVLSPRAPYSPPPLLSIKLSQPPPWLVQPGNPSRVQPLLRRSHLARLSLFQACLTSPELTHTCTKELDPHKGHTCRGSKSRQRDGCQEDQWERPNWDVQSLRQKLSKDGDVLLGLPQSVSPDRERGQRYLENQSMEDK